MRCCLRALAALAIGFAIPAWAVPVSVEESTDLQQEAPQAVDPWLELLDEGGGMAKADQAGFRTQERAPVRAAGEPLQERKAGAVVLTLFQAVPTENDPRASSRPGADAGEPQALEPGSAASSASRSSLRDSNRLFGDGLAGLVAAELGHAIVDDARQWFTTSFDMGSANEAPRSFEPTAAGSARSSETQGHSERLIPPGLFEFLRANKLWLLVGIGAALALALMVEALRPRTRNRSPEERRAAPDRRVQPAGPDEERRAAKARRDGSDRRATPVMVR